ncbi:hypothetical protein E8E13_009643 [Curvularia kusanoi]|uniref:Uncharacterized protein n=1 Tax=Curvularia kusanoi TaxID=90978 RepID=A0A9P4TNQ3_CURKU|nr:hypothetical protein E8E13_009643 [Curvularia kusanoi]
MSQLSDVNADLSANDWEAQLLACAELTPVELEALDSAASDYATPFDTLTPASSFDWDFGQTRSGETIIDTVPTLHSIRFSTPSEYPPAPDYATPYTPDGLSDCDYSLSQSPSIYGTPGPSTPDPYPIIDQNQQQYFAPDLDRPRVPVQILPRPGLLRSQTSTSLPTLAPNTRRRSLSQNAADLLASQSSNPTFIRLQTARSTINSKSRIVKHTRSKSRTTNAVDEGQLRLHADITSVPFYEGSMMEVRLGEPLEETEVGRQQQWQRQYQQKPSQQKSQPQKQKQNQTQQPQEVRGAYMGMSDVEFRRMEDSESLRRSRKIIEIGTMSVKNNTKGPAKDEPGISEKFDMVRAFLMDAFGDDDEVMRGCASISRVLKGNMAAGKIDC